MRIEELEKYNAFIIGKWTIYNKDDTGASFRVYHCGNEIDNVTSFSMDVSTKSPISLSISAYATPKRPAPQPTSNITDAFKRFSPKTRRRS